MKQTYSTPSVPTANIAVNKSRIKLYTKAGQMPTYYLQSGQEFQIELFNPTSDVILAKIHLNGKAISQTGLVLNPGQRVFLDRYLDVAKKFLFDTYEVSNTEEVKKAIEDNGDLKVEFYRESKPYIPAYIPPVDYTYRPHIFWTNTIAGQLGNYQTGTDPKYLIGNGSTDSAFNANYSSVSTSLTNGLTTNSFTYADNAKASFTAPDSLSYFSGQDADPSNGILRSMKTNSLKSKKIETGRVEEGSSSDQKFKYINKDFSYFPFHTVEVKMLPVSQKVNTVEEIKRYCTQCGGKLSKTDRFCSQCGTKA